MDRGRWGSDRRRDRQAAWQPGQRMHGYVFTAQGGVWSGWSTLTGRHSLDDLADLRGVRSISCSNAYETFGELRRRGGQTHAGCRSL